VAWVNARTARRWHIVRLLVVVVVLLGSVVACGKRTVHFGPLEVEQTEVAGPESIGLSVAGKAMKGVIIYFHGSDQKADVTVTDPKHKDFFQPMLEAGYAVVSADAGGNAFGNLASRQTYRELILSAEGAYRAPTAFFVAESMGALAALALLSEPAGLGAKGMVGISPLMGIPPAGREIAYIVYAWGGQSPVPAEADPLSWPPKAFAGRNFDLYYSDTDRVVPPQASAYAFKESFGAIAKIRVNNCEGGHVAPDCYRGGEVLKWMESLG
jgi:hypothetical protein